MTTNSKTTSLVSSWNSTTSHMTSILLNKADVPLYLRKGFFAESWDGSIEKVEIDAAVCKETDVVEDAAQLAHLLMSLRFWIVEVPPASLLNFVIMREASVEVKLVLHRFEQDLGYVPALAALQDTKLVDRWKYAVENNILFCVKYMHDNRGINSCVPAISEQWCCNVAAASGSLDCLRFLHEQGYPWDEKTCSAAAKEGKLDCLQYLHQNGCPWDEETSNLSAEHGHAECLYYAASNNCPVQLNAVSLAIEKGHISCLNELVRSDILLPRRRSKMFCRAAAFGQLEVLQYFHSIGTAVSYDNLNTARAAKGGHLHCLKYLHELGCPWSVATTRAAADEGHLDCLRYAVENGCPLIRNFYKGTDEKILAYFDGIIYTEGTGLL